LRQCSYTFKNQNEKYESFEIIQNGCSINEPTTVLKESRITIGYDQFGQVMFMHSELEQTKISIECTVDACLPPSFGKYFFNNNTKISCIVTKHKILLY
jgi:hypothetical protein